MGGGGEGVEKDIPAYGTLQIVLVYLPLFQDAFNIHNTTITSVGVMFKLARLIIHVRGMILYATQPSKQDFSKTDLFLYKYFINKYFIRC